MIKFIWTRFIFVLLAFTAGLSAQQEQTLPIQKVHKHSFSHSLGLNAKIIQLSNASQTVTSQVQGHLESYFVKPGERVKKGDKIALIRSMEVAKMSANYVALKQQYLTAKETYEVAKKLYAKGMTSLNELNAKKIALSKIASQMNALASQLQTLGVKTKGMNKADASVYMYAHSDGRIVQLLKSLHSSVGVSEPIVTLVKEQAYYVESYLPLEYAQWVKKQDKIVIRYAGKEIPSYVTQVLPEVDPQTQRVIVLSSIDVGVGNLFLGAFVEAKLFFGEKREYLAVKKSALSFFQNEWVVFVPTAEEHEKEESEHEEHGEDKQEEHHHALPYTVVVVKIITEDEEYVAIEGLREGDEYVSEKSYYVKSLLLKSSLGEHGH